MKRYKRFLLPTFFLFLSIFICIPERPITIMHIHAQDDTHVLFNGGAGKDPFRDLSTGIWEFFKNQTGQAQSNIMGGQGHSGI